MIKNDKQYKVTKNATKLFKVRLLELDDKINSGDDSILLKVERDALKSQYEELILSLHDYENTLNNSKTIFNLNSLADIDGVLIKARIANGYSQKKLADLLGVKEQQIQRYEAAGYSSASLDKINKICSVLGIVVNTKLFINHNNNLEQVIQKSERIGIPGQFITNYLISADMLEKISNLDKNDYKNEIELATKVASCICEYFNWDLYSFLNEENFLNSDDIKLAANFKILKKANKNKINAVTYFYMILATHLIEGAKSKVKNVVDHDAEKIREIILSEYKTISLESVLKYIWSIGIVVIPVRNVESFHGACIRVENNTIVLISADVKNEDKIIFNLLHELYHSLSNTTTEFIILEESEQSSSWQNKEEEIEANKFAGDILLNGKAEELTKICVNEAKGRVNRLKSIVPKVAKEGGVSIGSLANYIAFRLQLQNINWWGAANNLQVVQKSFGNTIAHELLKNVNLYKIVEPYRSVITKILKEV